MIFIVNKFEKKNSQELINYSMQKNKKKYFDKKASFFFFYFFLARGTVCYENLIKIISY